MAITNKLVYTGLRANLPTVREAGSFYLCTDTCELYFGEELYTESVRFYTGDTMPDPKAQGVLYINSTTGAGYSWDGQKWNTVIQSVASVKAELIGTSADTKDEDTIYGAKAYADQVKSDIIGTGSDESSDDTINGAKKYADEKDAAVKTDLIGTDEDVEATTIKGAVTEAKEYTDQEIASKLASTYKPGGSADAPDYTKLSATYEGNVYNISQEFTTDNTHFVDGVDKKYPAGTNIVVIKVDSDYKYDVLAGFVDLSGYDTSVQVNQKIQAAKTDLIGEDEAEEVEAETIKDAVKEAMEYADGKIADLDVTALTARVIAIENALTVGTFPTA